MSLPSPSRVLATAATIAFLQDRVAASSHHKRQMPPFQIQPTNQISSTQSMAGQPAITWPNARANETYIALGLEMPIMGIVGTNPELIFLGAESYLLFMQEEMTMASYNNLNISDNLLSSSVDPLVAFNPPTDLLSKSPFASSPDSADLRLLAVLLYKSDMATQTAIKKARAADSSDLALSLNNLLGSTTQTTTPQFNWTAWAADMNANPMMRLDFDIADFANRAGLGAPLAAEVLIVKNDDSTTGSTNSNAAQGQQSGSADDSAPWDIVSTLFDTGASTTATATSAGASSASVGPGLGLMPSGGPSASGAGASSTGAPLMSTGPGAAGGAGDPAGTGAGSDSGTGTGADSGTGTGTGSDPSSTGVNSGTGTGTGSDPSSTGVNPDGTSTGADSGTGTGTGSDPSGTGVNPDGTSTGADSGTGTGTGSDPSGTSEVLTDPDVGDPALSAHSKDPNASKTDSPASSKTDSPSTSTGPDGSPSDGTSGDGTSGDGTSGDGTSGNGTSGDGSPGNGATQDGGPNDGSDDSCTDDGTNPTALRGTGVNGSSPSATGAGAGKASGGASATNAALAAAITGANRGDAIASLLADGINEPITIGLDFNGEAGATITANLKKRQVPRSEAPAWTLTLKDDLIMPGPLMDVTNVAAPTATSGRPSQIVSESNTLQTTMATSTGSPSTSSGGSSATAAVTTSSAARSATSVSLVSILGLIGVSMFFFSFL